MYSKVNYNYKLIREELQNLNTVLDHFTSRNDICTPMECVEEMIDAIPDEFWHRDSISVLDPCAGNGNFPAYVLSKSQNEKCEIVLNEINEKRLKNAKFLFDGVSEIKYESKDFLADTFNSYDLIVANPPFALLMKGGKRAAKNHGVSKLFVEKALRHLNKDGYLVFIIPDNWMSLSDRNLVANKLVQYQFVKINIHSAKKYFKGVGSSFTWFVLKKEENKAETIVENSFLENETCKVKLDKEQYSIPLHYNKIIKSILSKTIYSNLKKFNIETSSDLHKYTKSKLISKNKNKEHPHELIHTQKQTVWSSRPHKYQNGWKTFVCLTSYYQIFNKSDVGMTQSIAFIRCENEVEAKTNKAILEHPLYRFINNIHRYGNFNNIRILQKFPIPDNPSDIWQSFKITDEEKAFILRYTKK